MTTSSSSITSLTTEFSQLEEDICLLEVTWPENVTNITATSTILGPSMTTDNSIYQIPSSFLNSPNVSTIPLSWQENQLLTDSTSDLSTSMMSLSSFDGNTYGLLGSCTKDEAVKSLGSRWNAVLFETDGTPYLGIMYNNVKYVLSIGKVQLTGENIGWGISWDGRPPEMFFRNLKKLVYFYSMNPITAFYDL